MSTDPHVENTVKDESSNIFSPLLCGPVPHSICTAELLWYYAIQCYNKDPGLCFCIQTFFSVTTLSCHVIRQEIAQALAL